MKYASWRAWCAYVATLAGIGRVAYAPGTLATAATVACLAFLSLFSCWSVWHAVLIFCGSFLIAYMSIFFALPLFGNNADPSAIVIDEAVGALITFIGVTLSYKTLILGFMLFRYFDIIKPLGIKRFERYGGTVGILADDVVAGLYTNGILHLYVWFFA